MKSHPDHYARFYRSENITLDIRLIELGSSFLRHDFRGRTCLELGPPTGYMTRLLVQDFARVTAVEGCGELLAQIPDFPNLEKVHARKKDLILVCVDRMPKEAVLTFDELNCPPFPGGTSALQKTLGIANLALAKSPFQPYSALAIIRD